VLSREKAQMPRLSRRKRRKLVAGGLEVLNSRVLGEVERHSSPEERVLFCLRGSLNHSLIAYDERLLIVKPGFHAGTTFGSLVTTFYYQDVTGIQLHTFLFTGWIEVSSPSFQGRERKKNRQPRGSDRDVYKLPNCIPISKRRRDEYAPYMQQLRERIEHCKRHGRAPAEAPPLVGSLERIADLHRAGVLSEAEFERLKQVLLENADSGIAAHTPPPDFGRKASGF
jgi:hypothetical protein